MGSAEKSAGRLVGTVIDPSVEAELPGAAAPQEPSIAFVDSPLAAATLASAASTGHPVRDRLLARAAQARAQPAVTLARPEEPAGLAPTPVLVGSAPPAELPSAALAASNLPQGSNSRLGGETQAWGPLGLPGFEEELDRVARPSGGVPGDRPSRSQQLPANAVALLGTFLGAATLTSLFALLIQVAPRGESPAATHVDRAALALTPHESAGDAAAKGASAATPGRKPGPWRIRSAALDTKYRLIQGKIADQPFLRAIQDAGLSHSDAYRVYGALKEHKDLDRCGPRDTFLALLDPQKGRVVAFEYEAGAEEVYQARENDEGALVGKPLDLQVERQRRQAPLIITGDFSSSAKAAGFDPSLEHVLNRALDGHLTVSDLKPGDRLRLISQEVSVLGEFSRYTGVEALEWSRPGDQASLRLYYFPLSGSRRWVDGKGRAPGEGGWHKPVKGAPVTSRFNPKRLHPILKRVQPHTGTDFGAPAGTPVRATREGVVSFLGEAGPNGNFIALQHDASYESSYSHLLRFAKTLKKGDRVRAKQVIGYVGSTGRSTGPHLHFSVKRKGQFIDPESLKLDALVVLPRAEREAFELIRTKYDALLDAIALPAVAREVPSLVGSEPVPGAIQDLEPETEPDPQGETQASDPSPGSLQASPAEEDGVPASPALGLPRHRQTPQVYLSDQELMRSQPQTDEDEVDE